MMLMVWIGCGGFVLGYLVGYAGGFLRGRKHGAAEMEGQQQILAQMPGKVIRLLVLVGDEVEAGQGLVVVEAMKMQNEIRSPKKGKVERVLATEGQNVNAGEVLAWVD